MVRANACRRIGVQLLAAQKRRMAVQQPARFPAVQNFFKNILFAPGGAVKIHQLRQTQNLMVVIVGCQRPGVQHRAGFVQRRGGHAGGQHKEYRQRQIPGRLQHELQPLGSRHIGDFMGVGDDGGGAVGQYRLGKGRWAEHGAFDMNVPVNQPRADIPSVQLHFPLSCVAAHAHDDAIADGHISLLHLAGKHVDDAGIFQHQLRRAISPCRRQTAL